MLYNLQKQRLVWW